MSYTDYTLIVPTSFDSSNRS